MHIAIITAGGAGMFCGSCMHDNTLARAIMALGHEVSLVPTYTPIRVDEHDVSLSQVHLGGINVYLSALVPGWRHLPRPLTRWLDSPSVLRLAGKLGVSSSARKLGRLTVALLRGEAGPERRAIDEFVEFLSGQLRPDIICFSNALLAGVIGRLKQAYRGPIHCLLQGDDIFLEDLIEPFRGQALDLLRRHARQFDRFLVHSEYYCAFMADYLHIPRNKFEVVPLGIDLAGHDGLPRASAHDPFTIGYFARICPEKGLHQLLAAFRILHARHPATRLAAGGFLGDRDRAYFGNLQSEAADLGSAFEYAGSPAGHAEKIAFLKKLDVLSVPTVYREPKGLYVLEALANGIPVVLPRHGAFPELVAATGGGLLVNPDDPADLARGLEELLLSSERRLQLATAGQTAVRAQYTPQIMAERTLQAIGQ